MTVLCVCVCVCVQGRAHSVLYALLANAGSRELALDYVATALERNQKKTRIFVRALVHLTCNIHTLHS